MHAFPSSPRCPTARESDARRSVYIRVSAYFPFCSEAGIFGIAPPSLAECVSRSRIDFSDMCRTCTLRERERERVAHSFPKWGPAAPLLPSLVLTNLIVRSFSLSFGGPQIAAKSSSSSDLLLLSLAAHVSLTHKVRAGVCCVLCYCLLCVAFSFLIWHARAWGSKRISASSLE